MGNAHHRLAVGDDRRQERIGGVHEVAHRGHGHRAVARQLTRLAESAPIAGWRAGLDGDEMMMTSELAVTEVLRAVRRVDGDIDVALAHLNALDQLVIDRELLLAAGRIGPWSIRMLDAIHLAAALAAGDDLDGVVTYDDRMAEAARVLGVRTLAPGR